MSDQVVILHVVRKLGKLLGMNYIDFHFLRSIHKVSFKIIVLGI